MTFEATVEISFSYGHRLLNYSGKCRNLHGHNALVQISVEGESLDGRGMLADFGDIKYGIKSWIDDNLDHRMILSSADPALTFLKKCGEPYFELDRNPTAEAIAETIYIATKAILLPVSRITFWETPTSRAAFSPTRNKAGLDLSI